MKFSISTTMLQALVAKAIKGAGFNKLSSLTSKIGITVTKDGLTLRTTDGSNYLFIQDKSVEGDFDVTVDASMFASLVSKLTSDTVSLTVVDNVLVVEGNGTYKLPQKLDDAGEPIVFPKNRLSDGAVEVLGTLSKSTIDVMLSSIKPSLSKSVGSIYSNYYLGDFIASTDRTMMCKFDCEQFSPMLLSREFVDLLGLADSDVTLTLSDEWLLATTDNMTIQARVLSDIDDFNIDGINKMLDIEFDSYCKVRKKDLLSLLERLSIFVGAYDEEAIYINFTKDGLEVSSMTNNCVEKIEYLGFMRHKDTTIKININRLITQLKAYQSESVEICYGSNFCVKLIDGNLLTIIALMK